eukprot:SAG31_NODE_10499_length_1131_cov_1.547481_1_plen_228_part_01
MRYWIRPAAAGAISIPEIFGQQWTDLLRQYRDRIPNFPNVPVNILPNGYIDAREQERILDLVPELRVLLEAMIQRFQATGPPEPPSDSSDSSDNPMVAGQDQENDRRAAAADASGYEQSLTDNINQFCQENGLQVPDIGAGLSFDVRDAARANRARGYGVTLPGTNPADVMDHGVNRCVYDVDASDAAIEPVREIAAADPNQPPYNNLNNIMASFTVRDYIRSRRPTL